MNRKPVKSSNIRSIGFENGVLEIEFTNNKIYRYTGPKVEAHYTALLDAESVGRYFSRNVLQCPDTTSEAVNVDTAQKDPGC